MCSKRSYIFQHYCSWLFSILGELERRFELREESAYQRRYIGRIAEILLNVWLDHEIESGRIEKTRIGELPMVYLGKVNWFKKGRALSGTENFTTHYRRYMDLDGFVAKLESRGFEVLYCIEDNDLAVYKDDNPYVIRIIARK